MVSCKLSRFKVLATGEVNPVANLVARSIKKPALLKTRDNSAPHALDEFNDKFMPSTVIRKTVNSVGANQLATIVVVLLLWLASPLKTFRHPDAPAVARRHHKAFSDVVTLHEQLVQGTRYMSSFVSVTHQLTRSKKTNDTHLVEDLAAGTRESLEKGLTNAYKAALAMRVPRKSYVEEDVDIGHGTKTLGIRSGNSSWSHVQSSLIGSKVPLRVIASEDISTRENSARRPVC